jgi:hypothetical protein
MTARGATGSELNDTADNAPVAAFSAASGVAA